MIAQVDGDVLAAHPQNGADIDDYCRHPAVGVQDHVLDFADVAVLNVVDATADHLAGANLIGLNDPAGVLTATVVSWEAACA